MKLGKGCSQVQVYDDILSFEGCKFKTPLNPNKYFTMLYSEFYKSPLIVNGDKDLFEKKLFERLEEYFSSCYMGEVDVINNDTNYSVYGCVSVDLNYWLIASANSPEELTKKKVEFIASKLSFDKQPLIYTLYDNKNNVTIGHHVLVKN